MGTAEIMKTLGKVLNGTTVWIIAIILGLALLLGWNWWNGQQSADQINLDESTAPVVQQDITVTVTATGTIRPITPVNISPKQSGRLVALYVEQGDQVKAGQVVAKMDETDLKGQLLQARGALAAAQANLHKLQAGNRPQEIQQAQANVRDLQAQLTTARITNTRNQELLSAGAISRNAYDESRNAEVSAQAKVQSAQEQLNLSRSGFRKEDIEAARASVLEAQGNLETIQTQLNNTVIRAPFAGVITQKYANIGAFVTPTTSASSTTSATSSSILALAGPLEAVVNVAETDIRRIYPGQRVLLRVDAYPDRVFGAKVRLVAPEAVVSQNVTSFEVRVQIDDQKRELRSGMNLKGEFQVGQFKQALLIPTTSVVSEAAKTGVYIPGKKAGRGKFHPIKAGVTVGNQTQVLAGLAAGDRVFITLPSRRKPNGKPVNTNSPFGSPQPRNRPPR